MLKEPPIVEIDTDILVLGGGLPGVCAAIEAARMGARVTLVEREATLGGNCGPEVGVHPSDGHRFHPYMAATGIAGELIEEAAFRNAKTHTQWKHYNVSMLFDSVLAEALSREGVRVLRRHYAHTPDVEDDRIRAVVCEDTATYKRVKITVRGCVIDDTGDGNVSALAGAQYRMGREAKSEYGERSAPEAADAVTMGSSLVALVRDTGEPVAFTPPPGTPPFHPGYGGDCVFRPESGDTLRFFFPTETGGDIDTIEDDHEIYRRLLGHLYSAWNHVKNEAYVEESRNWELLWVSPRVAKRESRRFVGDYTLTQTDVESGRVFHDAIAAGGFATDVHHPREEAPEYVKIVYFSIPPTYSIPYRCVYARDVKNLFFASRLLSASHMAHGTVRLQRTLAAVGQACGLAAAMCLREGCAPRELYDRGRIHALKQMLLREDATVPGEEKRDANDLTRLARASADSETRYGVTGEAIWTPLDAPRGCELWDFCERVETVRFRVRHTGASPVRLRAKLLRYAPEHPWQAHGERAFFDEQPRRNEAEWGSDGNTAHFREIAAAEVLIGARFEGWATFAFKADIAPKDIMNDDDRLIALIEPCENVFFAYTDGSYEFVRAVEGEKDGAYQTSPRACLYELSPAPTHGEAKNAICGSNRRYATCPINMWRPQALPATLALKWERPFPIGEIRVTLDTLTRTAGEMPYECGETASPQCAKRLRVSLLRAGAEVGAREWTDNCHRLVRFGANGLSADEMRITLYETWREGALPGIYDVRVERAEGGR